MLPSISFGVLPIAVSTFEGDGWLEAQAEPELTYIFSASKLCKSISDFNPKNVIFKTESTVFSPLIKELGISFICSFI